MEDTGKELREQQKQVFNHVEVLNFSIPQRHTQKLTYGSRKLLISQAACTQKLFLWEPTLRVQFNCGRTGINRSDQGIDLRFCGQTWTEEIN